uniref:Retrovirus-related Pol polyprotein from transposon TNT 1-94 n=1 Tax=Cajanus cajan TaxID=3821 RepID=A0A151TGN1_CAJCA|nr:Retrovirus-related Pol polyprotein from transposon TNT 1-94 [Cajanus cajan]
MNMVRSMLKEKQFPKYLWGEAASTAAYILNRCPSKRLEGVTPEEVWSNNKLDVSHLRVFGSIGYKHVHEQLRRKLDDKGEKMILLGYHPTGGYKLFNPISKQIMVSRDVMFDESKGWNSESNKDEQYSQVIIESVDAETNEDQNEESGGACTSNALRRSQRDTRISGRLKGFEMIYDADVNEDEDIVHFALFFETEPVTFEEAILNSKWVDAMKDELRSIEKNQVWELVTLPKAKRPISLRWVFKTKTDPTGKVVKHKARLVVCGFLQKPDIDYKEVFASVARIETIRIVVAIANSKGWIMYQLDVKSAFLNGPLDKEVYVSQPPGFEIKEQETKVYKLKRALYGLKQAPRAWNRRIDAYMLQLGFIKCTCEFGVYVRQKQHLVIVCLYVDDLLITGNHIGDVEVIKRELMHEFEMTYPGKLSYFLGFEFVKVKEGLMMHQKRYAMEVLKRFNMLNCNPAPTPSKTGLILEKEGTEEPVDETVYKKIVGSLRYLCHTRPDIEFSVGVVSRFMQNPRAPHLLVAKRILRYFKGTMSSGILFPQNNTTTDKIEVAGFTDADWGADKDDRRSTAGFVFFVEGAPISWSSKKESVVALSTCEVEYIVAAMCACQAAWLDKLLIELKQKRDEGVKLFIDNKSVISLSKNPVTHGRSKHIETKFHYLRDKVNEGKLELVYCNTQDQVADMFTKATKGERFGVLRDKLKVRDIEKI